MSNNLIMYMNLWNIPDHLKSLSHQTSKLTHRDRDCLFITLKCFNMCAWHFFFASNHPSSKEPKLSSCLWQEEDGKLIISYPVYCHIYIFYLVVFTFQTDNLNINMALNGGKEHMHMEKQSHTDTKCLEKSGLSTRINPL